MNKNKEQPTEILPSSPIRVETALSRYPVHRLAKRGHIAIDIREKGPAGEISIKWEVNHNSKYGQPGPLAYKLDTLIINRRIEEAHRPIPRVIRLGSLKEIASELGLGGDTNIVKRSLRQNASVFIIAKIDYKRRDDGRPKKLEADFTRYSVVFTGEELPDGREADAVYIILHDVYMQVLNGAVTRPLDYDYLKILSPAAQRFYELLSYQMYAAIKNDRDRAKLVYSDLCKYAPLTRQTDWNIVRPQLARIHAPHKKSGYIGKIDFQDSTDSEGKLDWIILYQPGPKALTEFRAFTKRGGPVTLEVESVAACPLLLLSVPEPSPQEAELVERGVTPTVAAELVQQYGAARVAQKIEYLDHETESKPGKIDDPAAWLVVAIRADQSAPKKFVSKDERKRREEAKQEKDRQAVAAKLSQKEKEAREEQEHKARMTAVEAYLAGLSPEALNQLDLDFRADGQYGPGKIPFRDQLFRGFVAKRLGL